jgi:DNA repair photolyase
MRHVDNPPNPYLKYDAEFIGEPPVAKVEVFEETATKSIITKNNSPDIGFTYSVNCYRGCIHACTYCFARSYHEYLGYGAGTDFETKIVAKINAPQLLKEELKRARRKTDWLSFSTTTDPYLPMEASYELTRKCLEVCRDFRVPVGIITKSPLVTRDIDILTKLDVSVFFSIPFLTTEKSKPFEPYTPTPDARFRAMETLANESITVGIAIAPVILGYNDSDIPALLEKAKQHGARKAFMNLLHLDTESIRSYFVSRLKEKLPTQSNKILHQLKREHGGQLYEHEFGKRMRGTTERWQMVKKLFELHHNRLGFEKFEKVEANKPQPIQQTLFELA